MNQSCSSGQCAAACNPTTNLATSATGASSAGSGTVGFGYGPDRMNDGQAEAACTTYNYHWVKISSGETGWTEYTWTTAKNVGRITIDTGISCTLAGRNLSGATIQWWSGSSWVTAGTVTGKTADWSFTFPSPVSTTKIRLYNVKAGGSNQNPVIYEWKVFSC